MRKKHRRLAKKRRLARARAGDGAFILHVRDIVQDCLGLRVRIEEVRDKSPTTGWGTTLNASLEHGVRGHDHNHYRVETGDAHFHWRLVRRVA